MRIVIDERSNVPIYKQVARQIAQEIDSGKLAQGGKLATVRDLSMETGLSHGTIKHAYDFLALSGHIVKVQGRGTFVRTGERDPAGSKARAMKAIDRLLDEMQALSFSLRDIRIFVDIKLREREQETGVIRVAAVDCSPEALSVIVQQIHSVPGTETEGYLLDDIYDAEHGFEPEADLVVTTTSHYQQLADKMRAGEPFCMVMSLDTETAVRLSSIRHDSRVGVICKSRRFAQIILATCDKYSRLENPVQVAYFGDCDDVSRVCEASDVIILAPNFHLFASGAEMDCLHSSDALQISYMYRIDRGSMKFLEERVNRLHSAKVGIK